MWTVISLATGFGVKNSQTDDIADNKFSSEPEAQAWADSANQRHADQIAENKRLAVEKKARLAAKGPLADQFFVDRNAH
jgi:hypothetical protein